MPRADGSMPSWRRGVCETNGARLHYLRTGNAHPPVVLLHGLMGSGACWASLARALQPDFDVVMPDARGHGDSSAPPAGYRYDDHARDVEALLHDLRLPPPVLLGHSMGGMTAALVAARATAPIRGLILVDPTFLSPERQREVHASDVAAQHRRALDLPRSTLLAQSRARHTHRASEILELQTDARLKTHPAAFDILTPPNPDYRATIRAITVPILLVIGDAPVVTLDTATDLRRLNPRICIAQIPDAGHGLPFDQPEALAAETLSFLHTLP